MVVIVFVSAVLFPSYGYWYFLPRLIFPFIGFYVLLAVKEKHFLLISLSVFSLLEAFGDALLMIWKLTGLDVYNLQQALVPWNSTLLVVLLLIYVFRPQSQQKVKMRKQN